MRLRANNEFDADANENTVSDDADEEEPVGLFSMNFLDDFDDAVFLNENDYAYDESKVQTGLEAIQFIAKKRFLQYYEKEIEKRLPIPAKILKKIAEKRKECEQKGFDDEEDEICQRLKESKGQRVIDYNAIAYEQRIKDWDEQMD